MRYDNTTGEGEEATFVGVNVGKSTFLSYGVVAAAAVDGGGGFGFTNDGEVVSPGGGEMNDLSELNEFGAASAGRRIGLLTLPLKK